VTTRANHHEGNYDGDELLEYLSCLGLENHYGALAEQDIDVEVLDDMGKDDMIQVGLTMGAAVKIIKNRKA